jgi:hypothetical protein
MLTLTAPSQSVLLDPLLSSLGEVRSSAIHDGSLDYYSIFDSERPVPWIYPPRGAKFASVDAHSQCNKRTHTTSAVARKRRNGLLVL